MTTTLSGTVAVDLRMSGRQMQVLHLIAEGKSNAEIAERLAVSEGTVKTHVKKLFAKLNVADRSHAVSRGYQLGLLLVDGAPPSRPSTPESPLAEARRLVDPAKQLVAALESLGWTPPGRSR